MFFNIAAQADCNILYPYCQYFQGNPLMFDAYIPTQTSNYYYGLTPSTTPLGLSIKDAINNNQLSQLVYGSGSSGSYNPVNSILDAVLPSLGTSYTNSYYQPSYFCYDSWGYAYSC